MALEHASRRGRLPAVTRALRSLAAGALLAGLLVPAGAALAADPLAISTPYPAVALQPGSSGSFEIAVTTSEPGRVDLAVGGVPEGWTATLRGGGFEVSGVFVDPESPPALKLDVKVPADATEGTYRLAVTATAGSLSDRLELDVKVAAAAGGTVSLSSDFPALRGSSDQTFPFSLELRNDTPQQLTFSLSASGPADWEITARPSGESQAASVTVDAGSRTTVNVSASVPREADAGSYTITVQAVAGQRTARAELIVEITGNVELDLSTPDQRLSASATAGGTKEFALVVYNTGTTPASGVALTASPPQGWEVTFTPETLDPIAPDGNAQVAAQISPSAQAIAGDYVVTFSASAEGSRSSIDVRVTVEASPISGFLAIALIAIVLVGLGAVFRVYGRR